VVLAVTIGVNLSRNTQIPVDAVQVAEIEKISGTVLALSSGGGPTQNLAASDVLSSGQLMRTQRSSGLAIRWHNGTSIRLDEKTDIRLASNREIDLLAGRIYLDTNASIANEKLLITTPAGQVRHVVTRYMTAISDNGTQVSVREGQVLVASQGVESVADEGEQLIVDANGAHSVQNIATHGAMWQWVEQLAPAFSSDGRSMADFLQWVASESGRTIQYASVDAEKLAVDTLLRGDVDMEPMRALSVMMQTSDLASDISDGTIVVRMR